MDHEDDRRRHVLILHPMEVALGLVSKPVIWGC
jgi:hypothetical protein